MYFLASVCQNKFEQDYFKIKLSNLSVTCEVSSHTTGLHAQPDLMNGISLKFIDLQQTKGNDHIWCEVLCSKVKNQAVVVFLNCTQQYTVGLMKGRDRRPRPTMVPTFCSGLLVVRRNEHIDIILIASRFSLVQRAEVSSSIKALLTSSFV